MTFVDYRDAARRPRSPSPPMTSLTAPSSGGGGIVSRTGLAALISRYAGREVVAQDVDPPPPCRACRCVPDGTACSQCSPTTPPTGSTAATAWISAPSSAVPHARWKTSSPGSAATTNRNVTPRGETMPGQPNPIPPDDLSRKLTVARPDEDQGLPHIGLVGDTYTILVAGEDTAGKYTLIDCTSRQAAGRPRTGTTSRKCSPSLTEEVRVTFRGRPSPPGPERPSTCPPTRRIRSPTPPTRPHGRCACAHPQARKNSLPSSASRSPPGLKRRHRSTQTHRRHLSHGRGASPPSTRPNCSPRLATAKRRPANDIYHGSRGGRGPAGRAGKERPAADAAVRGPVRPPRHRAERSPS